MTTFSIIQKSQLGGANRLDAEYYQPEYIELFKKLEAANLVQVKNIDVEVDASAFYPSIADYYNEKLEVPFIRVADIVGGRLVEDGFVYLPDEVVSSHKTLRTGRGVDIVISKGGTVGNAALLPKKFDKYALSRDIIFLKTAKLPKEYAITIYLFLISKSGINQLLRGASQQVQPHLTFPILRELYVPTKAIKAAVKLYKTSTKEFENSKIYYKQAEDLILEELGLKDFKILEDLTWEVDYSEVDEAERIDADYFLPKYEVLMNRISGKGVTTLSSQFRIIKSKNFSYTENGQVGILKTKQLKRRFVDFKVESLTDEATLEKRKLPIIRDRDVLFASMGVGSLGKTNIYYDFETGDNKKHTIDSTLRIFRLKGNKNFLPETLAVYLSLTVGQELIYKNIVGTSGIISIYEKYLENFPLPIIKKNAQQKIADLVIKAHQAHKKSKTLLEEAKRKVEEMIEKRR